MSTFSPCQGSPKQKAPAILWTLGLGERKGRRARHRWVLSLSWKSFLSRFPPPPSVWHLCQTVRALKEVFSWETSKWRHLVQGWKKKQHSARWVWVLDCSYFQRWQCLHWASSLVWGGQISSVKNLPGKAFVITYGRLWKIKQATGARYLIAD